MERQGQNPQKSTAEAAAHRGQVGAQAQAEPKLLEQVRNVMRMIYTRVLQQGGQGVPSPLDSL
jgi:hypothetical protein